MADERAVQAKIRSDALRGEKGEWTYWRDEIETGEIVVGRNALLTKGDVVELKPGELDGDSSSD